jgi:hypothetical protein
MEITGRYGIGRRRFLKSVALGGVGLATCGTAALSAPLRKAKKALVLVKDGTSDYAICLSEAASPSEKRGAQELQRFIQEMSRARLPIVTDAGKLPHRLILVGNSRRVEKLKLKIPFPQLGPEGFVLKTAGKHIVIAGGEQRGTMYGVYAFLEKLGCRWFTRDLSRIPQRATLSVEPLNETQQPAFEYRETDFREAFDKDWAARNKMNGSFLPLDESTGGKVEYYPYVHTSYLLVPPERYFADHPEYFALVDGRRRREGAQLCLTNPDVLRLSIQTVFAWIEQHPEASIYSVSQNDSEGWCECDRCRQVEQEEGGAHSGPILRFVNAIAAEVEKKYPEKLIDTLAYWYSEEPPAKVRPRPNVRIRLCPIGVCEAHPYERCPNNAYFMNHLRAWSNITRQLYIWHYVTNFAHYLLPFPDFDELAADIPVYKQKGVVGLFLEGDYAEGGGGENAELRSYIMGRLLWDTNADVRQAVDEFLAAYYGKAAPPMRSYFDLLHRQVRPAPEGKGCHMWIYTNPGAPYLGEEFLAQSQGLFRQAEAAAEDEATLGRVRKARLSVDYVALARAKTFTVQDGWYAPADLSGVKEAFKTFMNNVRSFHLTQLHEGSQLSEDEQRFSSIMKAYRVTSLENAALRVDIAPELSGRIIRLVDKTIGRDVLHHPDSGENGYPDGGGLNVFVYRDFFAGWLPTGAWELESPPEARALVLATTHAQGFRLRHRIELVGDTPVLRSESTLENSGTSALDAVLQLRCELDPGSLEEVVLAFRGQDGKAVEKKLVEPEQQPSGSETYTGLALPDGEWQLLNRGVGLALVNRFSKEHVARSFVRWTAKAMNSVTLGLWSEKRTLKPGALLRLEANYEIRNPQPL